MTLILLTNLIFTSAVLAQEQVDEPSSSETIFFTAPTSIFISDSLFIKTRENESLPNDSQVSTDTDSKATETFSLNVNNFSTSTSLNHSVTKRINQENGDSIFINLEGEASESNTSNNYDYYDDYRTFGSLSYQYQIQEGENRFEYLGKVTSSPFSPDSTDQTIKFIKTINFNPCTLESSSAAQISGALEDLEKQVRKTVNLQCMVGQRLNGNFFTSVIVTDSNGKLIKEIDLNGSLSLKVSEAITVKYGHSYLRGEDPFENTFSDLGLNTEFLNATGVDVSTEFFGQGTSIGQVNFLNREQIQGYIDEFEIRHRSNSGSCTTSKNLNLKIEDHLDDTIANRDLYRIRISQDCEGSTSESFSLRNDFEHNSEQATALQFSKDVFSETDATAQRRNFGLDIAQNNDSKDTFANFSFTDLNVSTGGQGREFSLNYFHAETGDSYLVAGYETTSPLLSTRRSNAYLRQIAEDDEPLMLKDVRLCFNVDCQRMRTTLSVTQEEGLFLSTEHVSVLESPERDFSLRLATGVKLNDRGFNYGVATGIDNSQNFTEISVNTRDCDNNNSCVGISFRKEESSTNISFGLKLNF